MSDDRPDALAGRTRRVRVTAPEHASAPDLEILIRAALSGERGHSDERVRRLVRSRLRLALTCTTTFAAVLAAAVLVATPPDGPSSTGALPRWGLIGLAVFLAALGCAVWFQTGSSRLENAWHEDIARRERPDAR